MAEHDGRPQDPFVDKVRPDPSLPPQPTRALAGLLGDSDRPGFRRIYFTRELDNYAEFRAEDMMSSRRSPRKSLRSWDSMQRASHLGVMRRSISARNYLPHPVDQFKLDIQLNRVAIPAAAGTGWLCYSGGPCSVYCSTKDVATCEERHTCDTCPGHRCAG